MTTLSQTLLWSSVAVAITAAASTPPTTRQTPSSSPSVQTTTVEPSTVRGDPLDPSAIGPSWVETMEDAVRRDRATPPPRGIQKVPEPESPYEEEVERQKREASRDTTTGHQSFGGGGSIPTIGTNFVGPREGDAGGGWIPPDTCGAIGPNHFVSIVNSNVSVWNKTSGLRLSNVSEAAFFAAGVSLGDGRCVYDPHSGRFILIGDSFNSQSRIYLAVSATSDPTGAWFKTSFLTNGGSDAGTWPDYPTLGVDANGIYSGVYAVGNGSMTIFALDKAPLVAAVQSLGTITAFRSLTWQGAIQPCVTYGTPGGEYCVTWSVVYRVNAPLTAPTLSTLGTSGIPSFGAPPSAPNMGGSTLDTLDGRLMNAVCRNGHVWTANAVNVGGRSAVRWYEIDPLAPFNMRIVQWGQIDDPTRHYFMPGIAANAGNAMVVGFTGSSAVQFAASYIAGRKSGDTAGQTCAPIQIKAGEAGYTDGGNPSRWGDYSLTSVDPTNDIDMWTIQEYGRSGNIWGTWIAKVVYDSCAVIQPTNFCTAAPNSANSSGATMSSSGSTSIAQNNLVLYTYGTPPNKTCLYIYAQNQSLNNVIFGNGFRCIGNPIYRVYPVTTSDFVGDVIYPLDLNTLPAAGQISAGQSWGFMCWYRDPAAGGALYNGSDGLSTTWCP